MDARIEAFLKDVLALESENWNTVREGVPRYLGVCEKRFRDAETDKRMKDTAAQVCRELCRARVLGEIRRHSRTLTAAHLRLVLSIMDEPARFPLKDQ
jgi:hypothetical protein